jgi:hypothetical protein
MQEPQYGSPGVRELMNAVATSRVPCMSIMNMPPFAYMRRVPGIDSELLKPAYTAPGVWEEFDPATLTLCSPDPQAIRPPDEKANVLQVTLPTNFKVARFDVEKGNEIVRRLEKEIDAARFADLIPDRDSQRSDRTNDFTNELMKLLRRSVRGTPASFVV